MWRWSRSAEGDDRARHCALPAGASRRGPLLSLQTVKPSEVERRLRAVIDRKTLRRASDARSFARGEEYCAAGRVIGVAESDGVVAAQVRGTATYDVRLWAEGAAIGFSCTCPLGRDGLFCKHCVAAGLAWCEPPAAPTAGRAEPRRPAVTMGDVHKWLLTRDAKTLVALLMERAALDDDLAESLKLEVAKTAPGGPDVAAFREAIDDAVDVDDFVGYAEVFEYTRGIDRVVDALADLVTRGRAADAIELVEHALAKVEGVIESVDDDGDMGPILARLQEIHLEACRAAKPDRQALARRLFEWELTSHWDVFAGAVENYADVLGEDGMAVYRSLAEAEWRRVLPRRRERFDETYDTRRLSITRIMEGLARCDGDIEALVAVKARDLSSAYSFFEIAEIYDKAGDRARALTWAEKGVAAFPKRMDPRLRELLAGMYHDARRDDDAAALAWTAFTEEPYLEAYGNLCRHAGHAKRWPEYRERALAFIRDDIARRKQRSGSNRWARPWAPDHSTLVEIFLAEKDAEAAWHEAREGGCSPGLWLDLADRRAEEHPEDALTVWKQQMEPTIAGKNAEAYRQAIGLLRKIHGVLARLGREHEFTAYLAALRATYKRLRNLMKMLDHAAWT